MQVSFSSLPIQIQHESVLALTGQLRERLKLASEDVIPGYLEAIEDIENRLLKPTQTPQSVLEINLILKAIIGTQFLSVKLVETEKIQFVFDYSCLYNML